jgi:hypothetical protein
LPLAPLTEARRGIKQGPVAGGSAGPGYLALQSALQQGPSWSQSGHRVPPGIYTSIAIDTAAPMCVAGGGVGKTVGVLRLNYEQRVVATTGVCK